MNKIELLAPARDLDCLKAVIENGADSIYMGFSRYNARRFGKNFSMEEFEEGVKIAHMNGKKVYLTLNVLIKENEMSEALEYAKKGIECGIDAILVQDMGLAYQIRKRLPYVELHASTQMTISNHFGVNIMKQFGFSRVVIARELNYQDIIGLKKKAYNMEVEVFIHGGLCIGYSGQCFASSYNMHSAANRGMCKMPCWMSYTLYENEEPLKSGCLIRPRDLCGIKYLSNFVQAGIDSFKIQGRLRDKTYISEVVRTYRDYIDDMDNANVEQKIDSLLSISERGLTEGNLSVNLVDNLTMNLLSEKNEKRRIFSQDVTSIYCKKKEKPISILLNVLDCKYDYSQLSGLIDRVYIPYRFFVIETYKEIIYTLNKKYKIYIYMPTMILEHNCERIYSSISEILNVYTISGIVLSNISDLNLILLYKKKGLTFITNYTMHITNASTSEFFENLKVDEGTISIECSNIEASKIICNSTLPLEQIIYGYPVLMQMKYCIVSGKNKCNNCGKCHCNKYSLVGENDYNIIIEPWQSLTSLYSRNVLSIPQKDWVGNSIRADFLNESVDEINKTIIDIKSGIYYKGKRYENHLFVK